MNQRVNWQIGIALHDISYENIITLYLTILKLLFNMILGGEKMNFLFYLALFFLIFVASKMLDKKTDFTKFKEKRPVHIRY